MLRASSPQLGIVIGIFGPLAGGDLLQKWQWQLSGRTEPGDAHSCQRWIGAGALLWRQPLPIFAANGEVTKGRSKPLCCRSGITNSGLPVMQNHQRKREECKMFVCNFFFCVRMRAEMQRKWFLSTDWINYLEKLDRFCTPYCRMWLYRRVHQINVHRHGVGF